MKWREYIFGQSKTERSEKTKEISTLAQEIQELARETVARMIAQECRDKDKKVYHLTRWK